MIENSGWDDLSTFMDGLYRLALVNRMDRVFILMNQFRRTFLENYPEKYINIENRYLDYFRFYYSIEDNYNENKLKRIFKKYEKIGFDNFERKIDIYIFYVVNIKLEKEFYSRILLSAIVNNYDNEIVKSRRNQIPGYFLRAEEIIRNGS